MMKYHIEMNLIGFDKGGNPHLFKDLPRDKEHPTKESDWHPCLHNKDGYIGPIFVLDNKNKAVMLEAGDLVRMRSYSWVKFKTAAQTSRRGVDRTPVVLYITADGDTEPVPEIEGLSLKHIDWK